MATYYIDFTNGNDTNDGTATDSAHAWATLDKFCANARSAGDIAIVRRGMTQSVSADLTFASDGTRYNFIKIEADYDNAWSDRVDLSATATATLTFGSKTVTFSASVSGVISAGDWIYASGDATREFAYEVESVSTSTVTLYLPYKGDQAGSGKTMYNMKAAPIWNTAAGNFQAMFDGDDYWLIQGIHWRGTDANGQMEVDSCFGHIFKDCIFTGNGSGDYGVRIHDYYCGVEIIKCRFYNNNFGVAGYSSGNNGYILIKDSLIDLNNISGGYGVVYTSLDTFISETTIKNGQYGVFSSTWYEGPYLRNCPISNMSNTEIYDSQSLAKVFVEDFNGTVGDNRFYQLTATNSASTQSETSTVRTGGGATSIKVTPSDYTFNNSLNIYRIPLFDYPIHLEADTEKTITVYFKTGATSDWTANPTASELYLEAEYWGHASNNYRRIKKSTGTVSFTTSTDWQSLTVTFTPLQDGVAYIRGYYGKTKESSKSNIFYVDTKPVIS